MDRESYGALTKKIVEVGDKKLMILSVCLEVHNKLTHLLILLSLLNDHP